MGDREVGAARVVGLARDRAVLDQRFSALDVGARLLDLGVGFGNVSPCAFDGNSECALIQGEQRIAGLDDLTVLEQYLLYEA